MIVPHGNHFLNDKLTSICYTITLKMCLFLIALYTLCFRCLCENYTTNQLPVCLSVCLCVLVSMEHTLLYTSLRSVCLLLNTFNKRVCN